MLEIGGIGKAVIERTMRRHSGEITAQRLLNVAMDHADRPGKAVPLGVFLRQHGITGRDLDTGDMNLRHACRDAECGDAGSDPCFEERFTARAWNGRR